MSPVLLHDLLDEAAARSPGAPALTTADGTAGHRELAELSERAARWLAAQGVGRGDRVVLLGTHGTVTAALVYGCARIGGVFSILHEQTTPRSLAHVLDDAEPRLLVADGAEAAAEAERRGVPVFPGKEVADAVADTPAGPLDRSGVLPVDPVCFIYTSGSTGTPKAVVSTHAQVVFAARAIQQVLRYRERDVVFVALPLSFDYGLYQLFLAVQAGAHVWLGEPSDAGPALLRALRRSGATVLPAVPSMAANLATMLKRYGGTAPLRLLTNTGAAMPAATLAVLRRHLPDLRVQLMYGLTECKRAAIMPPDGDLSRPGSSGRALPGTELLVVAPDGTPLPPGESGEIVVRGPHVMSGYWRRPELTAERFPRRDGLFPELRTGDWGHLDADGYLYFDGRDDDVYKSRGIRVSTLEVEAAAHRVPGVAGAAVLPPGDGRPEAVLFAVTGLEPSAVMAGLRDELEPYKLPGRCVIVDGLPLNGNGKTDRSALKALIPAPRAER
ncbi:class I adenylate-forming enzyme family protein [Actinomadura rubrisoli]|uniref:Long-chain fatty acid--CoA ligase n=1 Tax=Actinomadura rubrisoli TaxID=2530368 RepID=A0A4R5C887_9ACTN|nr:class I adenylate-forming enzyme family protein [Actinomadura rubrisoli]TDD94826.1 long-chain fatty acid--CoA ligase [Actinomadura rubrisoli]